jgi:DNA-binding CsgD family transcriptional regulator
MTQVQEQALETVHAFQAAAMGSWTWEGALQRLAHATGSQSGQLLGMSSDHSVRFNIFADVDKITTIDSSRSKVQVDGATLIRRALSENTERTFSDRKNSGNGTRENCRRDPLYGQILRPSDRPFIFLKTLDILEGTTISLLAARSTREEQITARQREIFAALVPHARDAVRVQIALERKATAVLTAAFDVLEIPAFIADSRGCVTALTRPAEALADGTYGLWLQSGRLKVARPTDAKALADAIEAAAAAIDNVTAPLPKSVVVRGADDHAVPLVLDVCALPFPASQLRFAPQVMIVAHGARASEARRAVILRTLYALTAAETQIAEQIADGRMPEAIAKRRGVAVGTVRAQIKAVMAKVGVNRQIELTARLRQI